MRKTSVFDHYIYLHLAIYLCLAHLSRPVQTITLEGRKIGSETERQEPAKILTGR